MARMIGPLSLKLFTKRQNFGLDQIECICRRQNKCDSKIKICFIEREENIFGKEENAVTSIFSFSQNVFKKPSFSGSLKVGIVWLRVKLPL